MKRFYRVKRLVCFALALAMGWGLLASISQAIAHAPRVKPAQPRKTKAQALRQKPRIQGRQGNQKMTWLIYMAGDNNLEPYIDFNRKQIEREGVPDDINLLLFMCTHRAREPKMAIKAIIKGNRTIVIEKIPNLDSGDRNTLIRAGAWAASFGPKLGISVWDHGFGPMNRRARRGVCYDNTTGHFLADTDVGRAFDIITRRYLKNNLVFAGFDACLMGALEIAAAVKPYAHYMIASEQTIPAVGWPYHLILRAYKRGAKTPEAFARAVVEAYKNYYDPLTQDYTLSVVDLNRCGPLIENVKALTHILLELISKQKNRSVARVIRDAAARTARFDERSYADLCDWYKQLYARADRLECVNPADTRRLVSQLKATLSEGYTALAQCIITSVQGAMHARTRGLLVYLPERYIDRAYLSCQWAQATSWINLLRAYLKA
jgi:hypothetical protein